MASRRGAGSAGGRRIRFGAALACALMTCAAAIAPPRAAAAPPAPRVHAATLEDGLPGVVCGIVRRPLSQAVDEMVSLLTRRRFRGTLAGALADQIGLQPWCRDSYRKLRAVLRGAARRDSDLRPAIGPFVFAVRASFDRSLPGVHYVTVDWDAFLLSGSMRSYELAYSVNGRAYKPVYGGNTLFVSRGDAVRFAVRIDNYAGVSSPWVFSPVY